MKRHLQDHLEFLRQFRKRFDTTGAVLPSSQFLARGITAYLSRRDGPIRVLEVGPGTGAITRRIVQLLQPEDHLDLVELNEDFVNLLKDRFENDRLFRPAASQTTIHHCALQEYQAEAPYDYIISGLPLNNFSAELVQQLFDSFFRLLAPNGVLSYFEYMYVRPIRRFTARHDERVRLQALEQVLKHYLSRYRFRRGWIFANIPPAWVQHLQRNGETAHQGDK